MYYQTICLSLLLTISFSQELKANQSLQRLFTTAQERTALNKERSKVKLAQLTKITTKQKTKLPPNVPRYITFNGLVTRSNGPPAVWINGNNALSQQGFIVELDNINELSVPIFLFDSKQTILLKPGQTVNTQDGAVKNYFIQLNTAK